ncbi:hypothetical protein BpHYR1_040324 [Brachionus plicatilis]|uniref:Uncharacterized protein n=1 Tax=Brachionus plicatilis TaxID=10195 RepID=A0A3M7PPD7_BRAPC|nr:hypothetical protein BpHYR1_040324 [Brachionus plicatilis]
MSNSKSNERINSFCALKVTRSLKSSALSNSFVSNTSISNTSEYQSRSKESTNHPTSEKSFSSDSQQTSSTIDNSSSFDSSLFSTNSKRNLPMDNLKYDLINKFISNFHLIFHFLGKFEKCVFLNTYNDRFYKEHRLFYFKKKISDNL